MKITKEQEQAIIIREMVATILVKLESGKIDIHELEYQLNSIAEPENSIVIDNILTFARDNK